MKKILIIIALSLIIVFLGISINSSIRDKGSDKIVKVTDNSVIMLFKYFKPLPELNMFIGSSVTDTYKYLTKNLSRDCSVLYGEEAMDIRGKIKVETLEDDISNYINEKNIQVLCNGVKYEFLDKQGNPKKEDITLMINVCNYVVLDYYIFTKLDINTFGKNPKILNEWFKYYNNYSSEQPIIEKSEIEEEFLGIKDTYELVRKYWYHELSSGNKKDNKEIKSRWPAYGNIFFEIITKKNTNDIDDKGTNILKFRSYLSHRARGETC